MADDQENMDLGPVAAGEVSSVEGYKFQPIKGYPMLNWRGKRPFTSTQFYPAQLKETYGEEVDGWRNKIFWGDNLQVMSHLLKEFRGKVDLVYIDPPFDSKADYKKKIKLRGEKVLNDSGSFEEKQYSDIWTNDGYLQFMYERLAVIRELLSERGVLFVHVDPGVSHSIKLMLDEIFGHTNFLNEIIWSYRRWPSTSKKYQSMHDVIFFYRKTSSEDRVFHTEYEGASESYMKRFGGKTQILDPDSGTRKITSEEETKGMPMRDVWDISVLAGNKPERVGYPTQKPEELLERIIANNSPENGLVFDCFMGSGTTQSVAAKLGRRFIGADINLGSVQTTTKRLIMLIEQPRELGGKQMPGFDVYNVNNYDVFRNEIEAKALLAEALEIQPIETSSIYDGEKDGRMVKIMPVNRIATKADLSELIAGFDYKAFQRRQNTNPNQPVEKILLVCMGHEPDLKAQLELEVKPHKIDVEVVDILRDKSQLEFKRDSEARLAIKDGHLEIERFYPMNLLQKLSLQKEQVTDWREMVESIMVDWNYDGAILQPVELDVPEKNELVSGRYKVPEDAGTVRVKITDLLSESWEGSIDA
ncbi:site-specific DNA-methyltransferase [Yoonia sp. BS5-3]|uniref:site-specific DNA-methyltransferase (adenine-specific) n=1 Tax=Yoonia phaeophyticola TaxID=3137369 RepID=A0ABZ2V929_9RHOB